MLKGSGRSRAEGREPGAGWGRSRRLPHLTCSVANCHVADGGASSPWCSWPPGRSQAGPSPDRLRDSRRLGTVVKARLTIDPLLRGRFAQRSTCAHRDQTLSGLLPSDRRRPHVSDRSGHKRGTKHLTPCGDRPLRRSSRSYPVLPFSRSGPGSGSAGYRLMSVGSASFWHASGTHASRKITGVPAVFATASRARRLRRASG